MEDPERLKIVYIEDSDSNLDLVARILEVTGKYTVMGALDGEVGIELSERERPALVLVDLDVPTINGFEIIRTLKGSADPEIARIPIAVVSANVLKNERDEALALGASAFIEKPFDIHQFRDEIARLIAGTRPAAG